MAISPTWYQGCKILNELFVFHLSAMAIQLALNDGPKNEASHNTSA